VNDTRTKKEKEKSTAADLERSKSSSENASPMLNSRQVLSAEPLTNVPSAKTHRVYTVRL
jgi:hypothetical protein